MSGYVQADLSGAILIGVLLFLRVFLRRYGPARAVCWLWDIAAARLVVPVSLQWAPGLGTVAAALLQNSDAGHVHQGVSQSSQVLGTVWLIGLCLCAAAIGTQCIRESCILRAALPVTEEELRRCRALMLKRSGHVRLVVSDRVTTGVAYGIFRRTIVLPRSFRQWDDAVLQCVLVHECMHFARRDNLRRLGMLAAASMHWWNPLVWAAAVCSGRDAEAACDECAVARLGSKRRKAYASALVTLAEEQSVLRLARSAFSHGTRVGERVARVLRRVQWSAQGMICALLAGAAALSSFACGGSGQSAPWTVSGIEAVPLTDAAAVFVIDEQAGAVRNAAGRIEAAIQPSAESEVPADAAFSMWITRIDTEEGAVTYVVAGES